MLVDAESGLVRSRFRVDINHAWYAAGDIRYRQGRFDDALIEFRKAYRNWPSDYQAAWAMADCYAEIGRPKLAARWYQRSIQLHEPSPELRYNLANAYFDLRRDEEARRLYASVIRTRKPVATLARKNLALLEVRMKR